MERRSGRGEMGRRDRCRGGHTPLSRLPLFPPLPGQLSALLPHREEEEEGEEEQEGGWRRGPRGEGRGERRG